MEQNKTPETGMSDKAEKRIHVKNKCQKINVLLIVLAWSCIIFSQKCPIVFVKSPTSLRSLLKALYSVINRNESESKTGYNINVEESQKFFR